MPNPAEETKQENVWEERFDRVKDIWPDKQFTRCQNGCQCKHLK